MEKVSARAENQARVFSPDKQAEKSMKSLSFFQLGLKKEREHAYRLCFRVSIKINLLMEICVLRRG